MAHPQALARQRVAVNMLNKQSHKLTSDGPPAWELGRELTNLTIKNHHVMKFCAELYREDD
jgi:hypothetical protein